MAEHKPLLIEIGCEELPPKALDELAQTFANALVDELNALHLGVTSTPSVFAAPRRKYSRPRACTVRSKS